MAALLSNQRILSVLAGRYLLLLVLLAAGRWAGAQPGSLSKVWVPDLGNGTYKNPVLYADYSDPDVVRVGRDYYLTSSSFNSAPGLQILHSRDLVNWTIIGAVFRQQSPLARYNQVQPGNGVWAPALRYHNHQFYLYYPDPDLGLFVTRATNPAGPWETPVLLKAAKGWIDPCPFWDDDGRAYLVHAFAGSRAGFKSVLALSQMTPDGLHLLGEEALVFDGHAHHPTIEGPKLYKRHGYYYIFAPGGGVATGWQVVLRSRHIWGPYTDKVVLAQGPTAVNGPHQGAWVDTPDGREDWFLHFQDQGPYGRVVHLEPMTWRDDWPVIGADPDGDGTGQPVAVHRKPTVPGGPLPQATPATSDEFDAAALGWQWQWAANPQPGWFFATSGALRLYAVPRPPEASANLYLLPNLLLQKLPAPAFTATARLTFAPRGEGEQVGLVMMGLDYAALTLTNRGGQVQLTTTQCHNADKGTPEGPPTAPATIPAGQPVYLRVAVAAGAQCQFSYSRDGQQFLPLGGTFTAREGRWIGAKMGLYCTRPGFTNDAGSADVEWFRVE